MTNRLIFILVFLTSTSVFQHSVLFAADNLTIDKNVADLETSLVNNEKQLRILNKEVTASLEKFKKSKSADDTQLQKFDSLEKSQKRLNQVRSSIELTRQYANVILNSHVLTNSVKKSLAKPIEYFTQNQVNKLSIDELTSTNNQVILDLENERNRRSELELQLNKLTDRREKLGLEITEFNKQLTSSSSTTQHKNGTPASPTPEPSSQISLLNEIEILFANQKLLELKWEQLSFDIRRDILRYERQISEKNVIKFEKNAALVQETLNLARTKVATESITSADIATKKFASTHKVLEEPLSTNQALANESAAVSLKITSLSTEKQNLDQAFEYYRQSFTSIRDKINSAGLSETIGIRLRNAKSQLPDMSAFSARLSKRIDEIENVQLRRIELEDKLFQLVDIEKDIKEKLNGIAFSNEQEAKDVKNQLIKTLKEQKSQFLPNALKAYDNYFEKTLIPLIEREKEYIKLIDEYINFIDERILWIKSSKILIHYDIVQTIKSFTWLSSPESWFRVFENLYERTKTQTFYSISLLSLLIIAFLFRKFFINKLKHYGRFKTKLSLAKFSDALMSGLLTLVLAAYWPFLFWIVGYSLLEHQNTDVFTQAVGHALLATANVLFVILLFLQMLRSSGLAESHFRWKPDTIDLVKHNLFWFGPLLIPLVFILQLTNNQPLQQHFDSLGRISFITICVLVCILMIRLLNPRKGLLKETFTQNKEGWISKTLYIWIPLALALPIGLSTFAILGYLYTATKLMLMLINSFWIIVIAIIVREFLIRWLSIAQRKLTLDQIRKKAAASNESESKEHTAPESDPSSQVNPEEISIDVDQISNQTIKLLNNFTGFSIVIGLYLLWSDILPALNILENITLWESTTTQSDGQIVISIITLTDALTAAAILLVTALIGVNIPGLLEISILQRLPFTPSARYGITAITRYIIVIIGTILTFNAIGVGWSKVQWLVAAVTVGLGFGLQEIFANFVSGIIILIERQIRVGDAVTVGDISGRVSRIKMRATTIIDWDRKELIIPNKEFVTGQVINWTLSDTVIRLVVPVGIAYGSDTQKAHDILIKIANESEFILKDPEPEAFFAGFGDSTLNFDLRVFLPNADVRIPMRHELLMKIDNEFKQAGIEIAFPQRDIHIRSMPDNFKPQT